MVGTLIREAGGVEDKADGKRRNVAEAGSGGGSKSSIRGATARILRKAPVPASSPGSSLLEPLPSSAEEEEGKAQGREAGWTPSDRALPWAHP